MKNTITKNEIHFIQPLMIGSYRPSIVSKSYCLFFQKGDILEILEILGDNEANFQVLCPKTNRTYWLPKKMF